MPVGGDVAPQLHGRPTARVDAAELDRIAWNIPGATQTVTVLEFVCALTVCVLASLWAMP
jgi:hypothetical protein